jgi:hypothetical protein
MTGKRERTLLKRQWEVVKPYPYLPQGIGAINTPDLEGKRGNYSKLSQ